MPRYPQAALRQVREKAGITRQQLSRESAVLWYRLGVLEQGRQAPTDQERQAIVEALRRMGVPLDPSAIASLFGLEAEQARQALRQQVREALERLLPFISQRRLEALLDLSPGYLSRLRHSEQAAQRGKSGVATPSATLVCTLVLLAADPQVRLQELRQFWARLLPPRSDPNRDATD